MSTLNIMVDLESMGVGMNPALLSIGAIAHDDEGVEFDEFEVGINLTSCIFAGLSVDLSTIEFWKSQSKEAQQALMNAQDNAKSLESSLRSFFDWIAGVRLKSGCEDIILWGNGMISDNVWLMSASASVGINMDDHVRFYEHGCFRQEMRNCKKMYGVNPNKELPFLGIKHDALDDARHQVRALVAYWEMLNSSDSEIVWNEALYGKDE